MVHFEGDRDFALPPGELWGKLTDVTFLVGCIPDLETVKKVEGSRAELVIRPSFHFVRGSSLDVILQLLDLVEPTSARFLLSSTGIGSSAEVQTSFVLASRDGGGTRAHWVAEVTALGGLLKWVPAGLIRGAAQKVLDDVWQGVETKLAAERGIA